MPDMFLDKLKKRNISKDQEKTKQRVREIWKPASIKDKQKVRDITSKSIYRAIYHIYDTGTISARNVIAISQVMNVNPFYLTGETNERGVYSEDLLKDLLIKLGYKTFWNEHKKHLNESNIENDVIEKENKDIVQDDNTASNENIEIAGHDSQDSKVNQNNSNEKINKNNKRNKIEKKPDDLSDLSAEFNNTAKTDIIKSNETAAIPPTSSNSSISSSTSASTSTEKESDESDDIMNLLKSNKKNTHNNDSNDEVKQMVKDEITSVGNFSKSVDLSPEIQSVANKLNEEEIIILMRSPLIRSKIGNTDISQLAEKIKLLLLLN